MNDLIDFFRAMGEERRVSIIEMILKEEMCICDLMEELDLSQSAVSHHVKVLKQAGLINDRRDGKWTYYSINKKGFEAHIEVLQEKIIEPVNSYVYKIKLGDQKKCSN